MEETQRPLPAITILLALALAAALIWTLRPAPDAATPWAAPVPTLQPTPALSVPTPAPVPTAPPVVFIAENNGSVTVNSVDIDVCIGLCR